MTKLVWMIVVGLGDFGSFKRAQKRTLFGGARDGFVAMSAPIICPLCVQKVLSNETIYC